MGYHNPGLPGKLDPGWWLTYPSEKYESQLGVLFPTEWTNKHVPNHQPELVS
jgi:hypothetical protein